MRTKETRDINFSKALEILEEEGSRDLEMYSFKTVDGFLDSRSFVFAQLPLCARGATTLLS